VAGTDVVDKFTGNQLGVTLVNNRDHAKHLTNDDLDVLVVDRDTLRQVHALDTLNEVGLNLTQTADSKDVLRVERSDEELRSNLDVSTVLDEENRVLEDRVRVGLVTVVGSQDELALCTRLIDGNTTGRVRDRARTLGGTCFEELGHAGKTLRDVRGRCRTTRVEGTHRELRSGLTD
jgi:hypothetical protein